MLARCLLSIGVLGAALLLAGCGGSSDARPDLVLVSTRDGDYAIYELNADGGAQRRLTENESNDQSTASLFFQVDPSWSPDGKHIAFSSRRRGSFDIYVMNADGTGTRRLTSTREDDNHPTWSDDGDRIAFARGEDIYVMDRDGSAQHLISDEAVAEGEPAWAPGGQWIAYVRRAPGTSVQELWLMRPDGSERRRLTRLGAKSTYPAWSPDGGHIAFASNAVEPLYDIFVLTLGTKGVRRLTRSGPDFEPAWSPDGSRIAFSQDGAIATVDFEGRVETLTDRDDNDSSPAWNPVLPPDDRG